jgi:4-hydroxy-3-polyprenylbenzoate decarboxylase
VTVYDPGDWSSPYASGSAKVDGYVVCPCSMATLATIASGAMQNLVHRAASVALKEERTLC